MTRKGGTAKTALRIGLLLSFILTLAASPVLGPAASADDPELQKQAAKALESLGMKPFPQLKLTWMIGDDDHPYQASLVVSDNAQSASTQFSVNRSDMFRARSWSPQEQVDLGLDQIAYAASYSSSALSGKYPDKWVASGEANGILLCGNVVVRARHWVSTYHDIGTKNLNTDPVAAASAAAAKKASEALVTQAQGELKSWLPQVVQALVANDVCKLAVARLPIIFIPGVAGSKLYKDSTLGPGQLWPAAPVQSRRDLALRSDGTTPETGANIVVGDILRDTGVDIFGALDFYSSLVKFLEGKGYKEKQDLEVLPYDWRLDNTKHLDALDTMINGIRARTGQKKVILVAHSMGGIIARQYVYSSAERASKVDSFITMGTPYWGAPKVYYALISGYGFGNPFVREPLMKILAQNMPAAYQLAPWRPFILHDYGRQWLPLEDSYNDIRFKSFENVRIWENVPLPDIYTESKDNDWSLNKTLINQTASFRALVGTSDNPKPLPGGVKQYVIIGQGVSTLGHFYLSPVEKLAVKSYLELPSGKGVHLAPRFRDGDGTVPMWSLETSTATATYYVPYEKGDSAAHGDLAKNKRVQEIIGQIVQNKPPDPSRFKKTEREAPSPAADPGDNYGMVELEARITFYLHSDAVLRVTDESGGVLGFNDKGVIEESLPGTFLFIDGVEYASIADPSQPYNVQVKGIREGKFTLRVEIAKQGRATSFHYPEVPVKAGTIAEVKINPKQTTAAFPELLVRTDGKTSTVRAQVPPPDTQPSANPSAQAPANPATGGTADAGVSGLPLAAGQGPGDYFDLLTSWELLAAAAGVGIAVVLLLAFVLLRRRGRSAPAQSGRAGQVNKGQARADVQPSVLSAGRGDQGIESRALSCPQCGAQAEPKARFCGDCGAKLGGALCPRCNTEVELGARFCGECGHALDGRVVEPRTGRQKDDLERRPTRKRGSRLVWFAPLILVLLISSLAYLLWRGESLPGGLLRGPTVTPFSAAAQITATQVPAKLVGSPTPSVVSTPAQIAAPQASATQTPVPTRSAATPTPLPPRLTPTVKPQGTQYIYVLTNAGNGLYIGTEESLKNLTRCSFTAGGINCGPTDLVTYQALLGPYSTLQEARTVLCSNITERQEFPLGVGLKGNWKGSDIWYGLWNSTVTFDCSKP